MSLIHCRFVFFPLLLGLLFAAAFIDLIESIMAIDLTVAALVGCAQSVGLALVKDANTRRGEKRTPNRNIMEDSNKSPSIYGSLLSTASLNCLLARHRECQAETIERSTGRIHH